MKGFRYGFGFVPNFKKLLLGDGGGSPSLPTAGNQGYYSADDINTLGFSSANNLNWWQDEGIAGSSNDLTQGTASANMTFIEHDTVTQFTLANQPTLVDLGGGELAVDVTGSSKYFNNFPFINDGDFVIEYIIDAVFDTQSTFTHRIGNDYIRFRETGIDINNPTGGQGFTQFFFGQTLSNGEYLLKIKRSVDDVSVYLEGVQVDVTKAITGIWSIPQILGSTHTTNGGAFKRVSLWNSADDSGAPDFELLPTEESCNVLAGQQVSRWNSTNHKPWLNYVENTVTQFLEGLSPQNGSFTYVLRANLTDPVTAGAMISSSIDSSGLFNVDADTLDFRDGAGTNNNFDFDNFDDVSAYAFTFDGTTLTGYKNSCVSFTLPIDATGQAFNLTDLGASTAGATMRIYEMGNYSSDLAKTDLDYFSYIKDINTNQFVLPLQLPACPIAPLIYPLSAFNAKNNNETAYTTDLPVSMATLKAQGFSMSCFVDTLSVAGNQRLFGIRNDPSDVSLVSDITVVMLGATQTDVQGYNGIGNTIMASIGTVKGEGLTHVGITYDGTDNTGTLRSYINGVETRNQVFTNWSATANSALLYWCGANNAGYTAENPNGMFAMPRLQDRAITAAEMLYLVQNPSICYDDIDNTAGLKDATIYAPTFGEYNGSTNQALVDPASGTTTVVNEPVDYDGTGLSVKCTT